MSTRGEDAVRIEQVRSIYRTAIPGITTTLFTVFVLTCGLVYMDATTQTRAIVFLSIMFVQSIARLAMFRAYLRAGRPRLNWRPWAFWYTVGTFLGGATLGTGCIWMVASEHTELQLIALLVIFACTGGAVGAFGAYMPAFFAFLGAIALYPAVWLLTYGDGLHMTIGLLFILWALTVAEQARRTSTQFVETVRLRLQNEYLVEDLRREKALAEEANVAKSRFLAAASHDLRQPVHALSVLVGALRAHDMNKEARGLLDYVDGSVRALSGLFGGLLDISRLDAGVVAVHRTAFALQPIIERVCRDFSSQARAKGVHLRSRATRAVVQSDPMLFERILRNIVSNAVTYTDRGKVLVGCRRHGPGVRVQVRDTGRGIAESEQQRVFQEFYQIGNSERDRTRGVGLGLAIVKRLTTLLNHPLTLQSWPGKGTCFTLEVPSSSLTASPDIAAIPIPEIPLEEARGLILVVDDELAIQTAMQALLQSWGYSVIAAGTCEEILEKIGSRPQVPALIICGYRLRDGETGSAVIERLRGEYNDSIPGMLITGDTAPDRIKEAQASGYLLLHKPVPNARLRTAIAGLIREGPSGHEIGEQHGAA